MATARPGVAAQELHQHRDYLVRFAMLQTRDPVVAEDVVQETLLAAVEGGANFSGQSSVKTWLTGILKHKIIDHIRRASREQPLIGDGDDDRTESEALDALFVEDGHWRDFPSSWGDPGRSFENKAFWAAFEACSKSMPPKTAKVFMMREVMELDTDEICKELGITSTNCWVMLHRARLALRECLQHNWFGKT